MFLGFIKKLDTKKQENVSKRLRELLHSKVYGLGFDEIFAKWLAYNLHRLNDNSVSLLEHLDPESYVFIRMSTVSQLDYNSELKVFKSRANLVFKAFRDDKRNMLEEAITLTNDKGIFLNMAVLSKVIMTARDMNRRTKNELNRYKTLTLD